MRIYISPYSQKMRNGKTNPKNYPYWPELIELLKNQGNEIVQIGVGGEPKLTEETLFDLKIPELVKKVQEDMDIFYSVDNFFPHLCHYYGKKGVVMWGVSNPELFGYKENINILKDSKYLRPNQFEMWEQWDYSLEPFIKP